MRTFLLLCLLCALPAAAKPERYLYEEQLLTRADPSDDTEGMSLTALSGYPVRGLLISVCAEEGETLAGDGKLRAWMYHQEAGLWMRNPDLDVTVSVDGQQCQAFPDLRTGYLQGRRVLFAADGVLVSGGTTVMVRIDGDTAL